MIGVALCGIVTIYSLLGFIFQCTKNVTHAKLANCFLILGYCLAVGWLVAGTVFRYKTSGVICSGDHYEGEIVWSDQKSYEPFLIRTGTLMARLIVVGYIFYGMLFSCGVCACIAVSCGYRRELTS